ncbi:MAG TPA: hypothetical protein DD426_03050 [Clostridiaceae bacterium]|nr:hypothetical protein [Clostridiaceae bacterium]
MVKAVSFIKKIGLVLLLSMIVSLGMVFTSHAANTADTPVQAYIGYAYSDGYDTPARAKTNSTSVYIRQDDPYSLWVRTFGYTPTGPNGTMEWTNQTKYGNAILGTGKWAIKNYIYENGGRSAYLNITMAESGTWGWVWGAWSPDCAGTYPYANP